MKKFVWAIILAAGISQLKAQDLHLKVDTSAIFKKYFTKPQDMLFQRFAPQFRLNDLNQQPLSQVLAEASKSNMDNMPVIRPKGNYNMPVAKLPGNSKMPVIDPTNGERLDLRKPAVEKVAPK